MESLPIYLDLSLPGLNRFKDSRNIIGLELYSTATNQLMYEMWEELARDYSACYLTRLSHKPVAIAGLARVFCSYLGLEAADYLCGLWRPMFIHDL